jgi:ATP-dependent DNA helicase DinG
MENNGVPAREYMTSSVCDYIKTEIEKADHAEVFVVLSRRPPAPEEEPDEKRFNHAEIVCRGSDVEVPALLSRTVPGNMTLHNHPSGVLKPSRADLHMAGVFGEEGIGSMITDNLVSRIYVLVEAFQPTALQPVRPDEIVDIFNEGGRLSKKLEEYETRPVQVEMATSVADSLQKGKISIIEAGTGTGKSLAYLVPSMLWVKRNKKRVIVATKTIALQEQLLYKDIPIARKVIPDAPEAALIKGRGNYLCLRKLSEINTGQEEFDFGDENRSISSEIQAISEWVEHHPAGDRAELPFQPLAETWEMVQSDADMCLGSSCPFYQECPFYQSRREAARAGILIVNQALFFTDLSVRMSTGNYTSSAVIPPFHSIILDEAHSIEDMATSHFSSRLSSFGLRMTLGKFLSPNKNKGLLERLYKKALRYLCMSFATNLEESTAEIQNTRDEFLFELAEFSDRLHELFNSDGYRKTQVHLDQNLLNAQEMEDLRKLTGSLSARITKLVSIFRFIHDEAKDAFFDHSEAMDGFLLEFQAKLNRLSDFGPMFKQFGNPEMKEHVQWLTLKRWKSRRNEFEYQISPIDVSALLAKGLFSPFHSVIATSATLNLKDNFHFFQSRAGIDLVEDKITETLKYASPFPLKNQASFLVPLYMPQPNHAAFPEHLKESILELTRYGEGGTLVLFTSYALLNQMVQLCEDEISSQGRELLVQGRDPRPALLHRFLSTQGVLFGTDTFWEGIDLRGTALTKLLITKLPFRQMGDPVFVARSRKIKASGGSDFKDYSLPLALLKFKQGAGRLIRSKTDQGIIVVTDSRIISKFYGKKFFDMAPEFPRIVLHEPGELGPILEDLNL